MQFVDVLIGVLTLGQGAAAMKPADLTGKAAAKQLLKVWAVDAVSDTAAYTAGYVCDELGMPPGVTFIASLLTGCMISLEVGKYVFRDGGKIVKQLDADEMLEYVGGKGGTDVWDMKEGGGIINGREYSQHAMERMAPDTPSVRAELSRRAEALAESKGLQVGTQEYYQFCQKYVDPRNIPPSVIEDAIRNTTAVPGHTAGTFVHQTADVTVIVNDTGKVITVIPK